MSILLRLVAQQFDAFDLGRALSTLGSDSRPGRAWPRPASRRARWSSASRCSRGAGCKWRHVAGSGGHRQDSGSARLRGQRPAARSGRPGGDDLRHQVSEVPAAPCRPARGRPRRPRRRRVRAGTGYWWRGRSRCKARSAPVRRQLRLSLLRCGHRPRWSARQVPTRQGGPAVQRPALCAAAGRPRRAAAPSGQFGLEAIRSCPIDDVGGGGRRRSPRPTVSRSRAVSGPRAGTSTAAPTCPPGSWGSRSTTSDSPAPDHIEQPGSCSGRARQRDGAEPVLRRRTRPRRSANALPTTGSVEATTVSEPGCSPVPCASPTGGLVGGLGCWRDRHSADRGV